MVETKGRCVARSDVSQSRDDGAPATGQQGFDDQMLDFVSKPALSLSKGGCAEETLKGCQEGVSGLSRLVFWVQTLELHGA